MTTIDVILVALRGGPKSRAELYAAGSRKWSADDLTAALAQLAAKGVVRCERTQPPRGRPAEVWRLSSPELRHMNSQNFDAHAATLSSPPDTLEAMWQKYRAWAAPWREHLGLER